MRLVQGSALDRFLKDPGLRGRLGHKLADTDVKDQLKDQAKKALEDLDERFSAKLLPDQLGLGVTGGPGLSLNALVGLTADKEGVKLPLASWGAGTRRLAALTIARTLQGQYPVIVIDELERGLEPYRQRELVRTLTQSSTQVFVTTHSAAVVNAATEAALWYLDANSEICSLSGKSVNRQQQVDPEVFLSRLAVVCEGATEVGFATELLEQFIQPPLSDHGLWFTNAGSHENALSLLESFTEGKVSFAGMVDNEFKHETRWKTVKNHLGALLYQWEDGCIEQVVIKMFSDDELWFLIEDNHGRLTGERCRTLAIRLNIDEKDFESIKSAAGEKLRDVMIEAATGTVPDEHSDSDVSIRKSFQKHGQAWLKTVEGGRELANKALRSSNGQTLKTTLKPFVGAIQKALKPAQPKEISDE